MTNDDIINEFKIIHNNTVGYDKFVYIDKDTKGNFKCLNDDTHGYFEQRVRYHRIGKTGCEVCKFENRKRSFKSVIKEAKQKHKNLYEYFDNYNHNDKITSKDYLKIKCKQCSFGFDQTVKNHLGGTGCPNCSITGFKTNKNALFYFFELNYKNYDLVKIGITNNSIEERYPASELKIFSNKKIISFENGIDALKLETYLKNKYKEYKYDGEKILKNGNTELFNKEILNYIYNDIKSFSKEKTTIIEV